MRPYCEEIRERSVYKITCLVNGKMYIGQTVDFNQRMWQHKSGNDVDEMYIDRAIQHHGKENFVCEIICYCGTKSYALEMEKFFIAFYDTFKGDGYNLTEGGEGFSQTEESKFKISRNHQGRRHVEVKRNYIGVATHRRGNSYVTSVHIEFSKTKAKTFKTEIEAAEAYDKMVLFVYGHSANLNFPEKRQYYLSLDLKGFYDFFLSGPPQNGHSKYKGVTLRKGKWVTHFFRENLWKILEKVRELGAISLRIGEFENEDDAARVADKVISYFELNSPFNFPEESARFDKNELDVFIRSHLNFKKKKRVPKPKIIYPDRETLYELAWENSMEEIGRSIGACGAAVRNYAIKLNIPIPNIAYTKTKNPEKRKVIKASNPLPPL